MVTCTVVHFSPNGTTARMAGAITAGARERGALIRDVDLVGKNFEIAAASGASFDPSTTDVLFIGSPVYVGRIVQPVKRFVDALPSHLEGIIGVPYVTYGGVQVAGSLKRLATMLGLKGVKLAGAASFVARHSLIFDPDADRFADRPGEVERDLARHLTRSAIDMAIASSEGIEVPCLDPSTLPPRKAVDPGKKEQAPGALLPGPGHKKARCKKCMACISACPTKTLSLVEGNIERGEECTRCHTCVRDCPEKAWTAPLLSFFPAFHKAKTATRDPATASRIFLPVDE